MTTDQPTTSPYSGLPIVEWFDEKITLRDVSGDKIGELVEINPDYLIAESDGGFLGLGERHHYYVPRHYVAREDGGDWYLSASKSEIESLDWRQPPAQSSYAGGDWRQEADTQAGTRAERTRIVTHEERLQARPVQQQTGEVEIRKEVVEDVQTIDVPVRREEVVIERRPVSGETADTGTIEAAGETVRVPLMEEQVEVTKVVRPVEEVEVSKRVVEDTRTVSDTVRREEVRVDGDAQVDQTQTRR